MSTMIDLNDYQTKVLSQWGQDGVLEKIFDTIGVTNRFFVEFGSNGNDNGLGNTAQLRRKDFDGLLMDGSERPYSANYNKERNYKVQIEFITASNINILFDKYNVPNEFDLLTIDDDGQDFHIWNALDVKYSPRVVTIEMNHMIEPGLDKVMDIKDDFVWEGDDKFGASVTSLKLLGIKKGYSLVATCMSDAVFVRNDLIYDKDTIPFFININDEHELVRRNIDIANELKNNYLYENQFNIPFFHNSTEYL